ncbi:MAG TPA: AAA family ATPase [Solirubrobacteraceae bacterium]|nr:AAA family ATPase [Solirubrobacteraceae bacterium]
MLVGEADGTSGTDFEVRARVTSNHFVGRLRELGELEHASNEAAGGQPGLVLLGGESGVGKTRLVTEFERQVAHRPVLVLRGEAVEQADGELPYAPLIGALRPLVRQRDAALDGLAPSSRGQLSTLLPGLGDGEPPPARDDPTAQVRLFEALLELVDVVSESCPLVLILEDMHWADRSTRGFITFLARSLRHERVLVLLTYRTDEIHRRHALRPLLSELERLERSHRIELAPFDRGELREALTDILGGAPSDAVVERLFARSEGNPLFTEELVAAGLDGRGAPPQSLRDAFLLRIERLSPEAQRLARAIAVGRRLDEETLAEVTPLDHTAIQGALREARAEQILVALEDGSFAFRHALLREVLYDDLLPGERVELHRALAGHLEERHPAGEGPEVERAALVAAHYAAAGDQPAALRASVQAALAARSAHAYGEAADLAERALELWPRVLEQERHVDLDHVGLLVFAAQAHSIADDRARSEVLLQSAVAEVDADREPVRYASVLDQLARIQWAMNRGQEGLRTAQEALDRLPEGELCERASLLSWLARTRLLRGHFREALDDGRRALAAAVDAGDRDAESEVLNTLGMTEIALGQIDEGVACLREAIELGRRIENQDGVAYAFSNLADLLNLRGRTREALEVAREGLDSMPSRMGVHREWLLLTLSEIEFEAGDWRAARGRLDSGFSHPAGLLLMFRLLRESETALGDGEHDLAHGLLEQVEPLVARSSEPQWIAGLGVQLGELRRREGDLSGARAAVQNALDRIELCTDDVMRVARVSAVGARIEADIAQRARDLREPKEARDAVTRGRIHAQRLKAVAQTGGPVEAAWSAVGAAELARARGKNDPAQWAAVAERWQELQRPYQTGLARWQEAEAHVERGDRASGGRAADAALEVAQQLQALWLKAEVLALRDRARLTVGDSDGAARAPAESGAQEDPFGLTARERQVLALLAEGATNRQIGAALYMAEKTASVHVSRILSKLGVHSRTQAAAVAHRLYLAG